MPIKNTVSAIEMQTFHAVNLHAVNWQPINPAGLRQPCFMIRIINNCGSDIELSYDGVTAHDFVQDNNNLSLLFQVGSRPTNQQALMPIGTIVYVRGTAPQNGEIYLTGYYQRAQD